MQSTQSPSSPPFHTSAQERAAYGMLTVVGILVGIAGIVLEFVEVTDSTTHGLWSTISLLGFGIATVFVYILRMPPRQ